MLSDLAPLPQLLAVVILSVASAWTSMTYRLRFGFGLLPIAFIVCNPFFLENLSYRYDSLSMAAAVVLATLPEALDKRVTNYGFYVSTSLILFSSLNLYQPAINIFIVLSFYTSLLNLEKHDLSSTIIQLVRKFVCLAVAMGTYKIETAFLPFAKYTHQHSEFVKFDNLAAVFHNIRRCFSFLSRNLLHTHQTQLLLALMFLGMITFLARLVRAGRPEKPVFLKLAVAAFLTLGMLGGIMGPVVLLQNPVWAPRVLMGFGAVAACMLSLLPAESGSSIFRRITSTLLVIVLLAQFSLSYAFGNILIAQGALDTVLATQIVNKAFLMAHDKPSSLIILGKAPKPPNVVRETKWYPILNRLLPSHQKNFWTWKPLLKLYGLPNNIKFFPDPVPDRRVAARLDTCTFQKMSRELYYNIYKTSSAIIIDFSKRCSA